MPNVRIAVVGDSYVEAVQLFDKYNFMSVLQERLSQVTEASVEVLNFGRSGMDLRTMYIYDQELIRSYVERNAAQGEAVDVRCLCLGMAAKMPDPVTQIIHCNEKDIRRVVRRRRLKKRSKNDPPNKPGRQK